MTYLYVKASQFSQFINLLPVYKEVMVGMVGDIKDVLQVVLKMIQSFKSNNFLLGKMILKEDAVFL